ncbi:aminoglycoside phosphotransferase family protein [Actinoplanes sp. N902-109]|uniref:aminoglycoside phosphotransferase family protein n=1 Tax=Actinoplanes sp. (strain N902-109) TaxID=649831 RepID=UPI0003296875|nr:aminoglycoside phosphotransferase family protein [Actinoplanes sp. N902-109]AGL17326.1 hydroxyurea phosphotransferase [Actinoplanes sp. N902-109]
MTTVPADLPCVRELSRTADGRRWLATLPGLIEQVSDAFGLFPGPPLHGGSCSWVAPATLADGTSVILKIGWPHREMYAEPAALRLWDGHGAVRLFRHDPVRHALVLERCLPGEQLAAQVLPAAEALRIGADVLRELWSAGVPEGRPAHPAETIETLVDMAGDWGDLVAERMTRLRPGYDRGLVAEGARLLHDLPASAPREVVLHGDFNPGNILSSGGGWVAIDPKPLIGDPAYDVPPLLGQVADPHRQADPERTLRERTALLAAELDLDPARIAGWSVARKVESALWRAHHGREDEGAADMAVAALHARLL